MNAFRTLYKNQDHTFSVSITTIFFVQCLTDFERRDDDELGFRKNDIITVINAKDEHCWVGELNGLRYYLLIMHALRMRKREKDQKLVWLRFLL
jgi:hypothetical protein